MNVFNDARLTNSDRKGKEDRNFVGPLIRDLYIIHYITSGSGYFKIGDITYSVSAGDSFIIRPFTEVEYYSDENDPWEYVWVDFTGEPYADMLAQTQFSHSDVIGKIEPEHILRFYQMAREAIRSGDLNTANGLLCAIIGVYADRFPSDRVGNPEDAFFDRMISTIRKRCLRGKFNLSTLCSELHISRTTLHRIFKQQAGISPGKYVMNYRIKCAKEYLRHGCSVKTAAFSCGFSDPLYFSKAFTTIVGVSPMQYGREQLENQKAQTAQTAQGRPDDR